MRILAAATVPVWIALMVHHGVERLGRFSARPVATAAACGVAALVAGSKPVERHTVDVAAMVAVWIAMSLGLTGGVGDPSTIPLALGVAGAVAVVALIALRVADTPTMPAVLCTVGGALVVAGFAIAGEHAAAFGANSFDGTPAGTTVALLGVALLLDGALDANGPTPLAVAALATAAIVGPHAGTPAAVVVPAGALAVAAAWFDRGTLAAALTTVAVLAAAPPAGLLLAAATVVAIAVPSSPALLAAVPGAAAVAIAATRQPSIATVGVGVTVALVAVLLTVGRDLRPAPIPLRSVPAVGIGACLFVAAGTWRWAGETALEHWDRGAGVAIAAGLLAVVVGVQRGWLDLPPALRAHDTATDAEPGLTDRPWARRALISALALLGIALVALVRSALRSV